MNMTRLGKAFAAAPFALLSACNTEGDPMICLTPSARIESGDWKGCNHKWAYRLARSDASATEVAKAVAAACSEAADYQIDHAPALERAKVAEAINRSMEPDALFRVVQARAGKCAPR